VTGAQERVGDDPIINSQTGCLGQVDIGLSADAGDDPVDLELARGRGCRVPRLDDEAVAALDHVGDHRMGHHLDALLSVVVVEEPGQVRRKEAAADGGLGQDQHDLFAIHGQGCRDLRADESAADHGESLPALCLLT
jgi:hypothetical protein